MVKLIFKIVIILVLILLFGSVVFSVLSKVFSWLSVACDWLGNVVDWFGINPLIKIGGGDGNK